MAAKKKKLKKPLKKAGRRKTKTFVVKAKKKVLKRVAPAKAGRARAAGVPEKLKLAALSVLSDRKAEAVVTFDVRGRSALADYVIIATGRSARQLAAIADYLHKAFLQKGARKIRVEGLPQGDWVLVDAGDVIVHLFRPEVRRYYNIEEIWKKSKGR